MFGSSTLTLVPSARPEIAAGPRPQAAGRKLLLRLPKPPAKAWLLPLAPLSLLCASA